MVKILRATISVMLASAAVFSLLRFAFVALWNSITGSVIEPLDPFGATAAGIVGWLVGLLTFFVIEPATPGHDHYDKVR